MGSKWAELPDKITNGLGWVGRKVVENNVCPMGMGCAGLKPAQPAHCPTLLGSGFIGLGDGFEV